MNKIEWHIASLQISLNNLKERESMSRQNQLGAGRQASGQQQQRRGGSGQLTGGGGQLPDRVWFKHDQLKEVTWISDKALTACGIVGKEELQQIYLKGLRIAKMWSSEGHDPNWTSVFFKLLLNSVFF